MPTIVRCLLALWTLAGYADAEAATRRKPPRPAPLAQTGQVKCYSEIGTAIDCAGTGQDGEIRAGIPMDFVDNGDGTISDRVTGLMWEKMSDDDTIHDRDTPFPFGPSKADNLNAAVFAGYTDWRIPNVREAESLQHFGRRRNSTHPAFQNRCRPDCTVQECSCFHRDYQWTSTARQSNPFYGWIVGFNFGRTETEQRPHTSYPVRAVRKDTSIRPRAPLLKTGQRTCWEPESFDYVEVDCEGTGYDGETRKGIRRSFVDNGDGTITDRTTGLMWEKLGRDGSVHDVGLRLPWKEAFTGKIATLNGSAFAGHTDWRVPNIREVKSLTSFGRDRPAVYPVFDSACEPGCSPATCSCGAGEFWSSTTFERQPYSAWTCGTTLDGTCGPANKGFTISVRAVRTTAPADELDPVP